MIIEQVPDSAESLVLIVDDPDAPDGLWTHWTLWNIDPRIEDVPEGGIVDSPIEGITSGGTKGYHGPCPSNGTHHYNFHLYALDTKLDISSESEPDGLKEAMMGHVIDEARLTGLYQRR